MITKKYEDAFFSRPTPPRLAYVYGYSKEEEGPRGIVLGKEHEYTQDIKSVVLATYAVATSTGLVFKLVSDHRFPGCHEAWPVGAAGAMLQHAMQHSFAGTRAMLPAYQMNPLYDLLQRCCDRHLADGVLRQCGKMTDYADAFARWRRLEALVHDIRQEWACGNVREALDGVRRRADKRGQTVKTAIIESFKDCERIMPLQMDFHFVRWADDFLDAPAVTEREAYGYLVKLQRYLRERQPLVRYLYAVERGHETGSHVQMCVLLDGDSIASGGSAAQHVGEHWEQMITKERGRYLHCNAIEDPAFELQPIHRSEQAKVDALVADVQLRLAKSDIWMHYEGSGKSFGTNRRGEITGIKDGMALLTEAQALAGLM